MDLRPRPRQPAMKKSVERKAQEAISYALRLSFSTCYNEFMKCPKCNQEMKKVRWDISTNPSEANKEYDRTVYQCAADDIWVTAEIPKEDKIA